MRGLILLLLLAAGCATVPCPDSLTLSGGGTRYRSGQVNAFLEENLVGMTTVQLFCQERRSFEKFDERNQGYLNANLRSVFYYSLFLFNTLLEIL